jgi:hypothetical protein
MTRLWEKEVEIYESLLLEINGTWEIRRDILWKFEGFADGKWKVEFPYTGLDELARKRLSIQLEMFGRSDVNRAYEECQRLFKECVLILAKMKVASDNLAAPEAGTLPEDQRISGEDVARQQVDLFKMLDAADKADLHLTKVVSAAVQRVPTARRSLRRQGIRPLTGAELPRD